jgi:methionine-S-sulfoxide reductase
LKIWKFLTGIIATAVVGTACSAPSTAVVLEPMQKAPANAQSLIVAGGCFWCLESMYEQLKGVYFVESGYAGGSPKGATYEEVSSGGTGHAEAVKIVFDPKQISAEDLLRVFFTTHDPTTLNRQGPDSGTQYRSAIFFSTATEKTRAEKIRTEMQRYWKDKIVTTIEPLKNYSRAEEYHQNYYEKYEKATDAQRATMNAGYCAAIIEPKVRKFREHYLAKLKKQG